MNDFHKDNKEIIERFQIFMFHYNVAIQPETTNIKIRIQNIVSEAFQNNDFNLKKKEERMGIMGIVETIQNTLILIDGSYN